jgi:hypothetical protein
VIFLADYPEWVMKYKKKGTYINRVKDKYYLYAAHSERIPGTKKVRRVSDGYIGRITEDDGLIPAREKVSGEITVLKYGLHMAAFALSGLILKGLRREFRGAAESVLIAGILLAIEYKSDEETFFESYLSVAFPDICTWKMNEKQKTGAERCSRMVRDKLDAAFGNDIHISPRLAQVYAVFLNKKMYLSKTPSGVKDWLIENHIDWSELI